MIQVASQQVQLAALVEACKRRQLLSRQSVGPQVYPLGGSFMIGEELWAGLAILSPDALFLLKVQRQNDQTPPRPGRSTDANLEFCSKPILTVKYTELPLPLTQDQGWPKPPSLDCEVAILLRDEVRQVRAVPFTTALEFDSTAPRIRVTCNSTGPEMAAERLQRSGWMKDAPAAPAGRTGGGVRLPKTPTPYVIVAGILAFALATTVAIQLDSMNTQLSLLLCMPILALVAYIALKYTGHWPAGGERNSIRD